MTGRMMMTWRFWIGAAFAALLGAAVPAGADEGELPEPDRSLVYREIDGVSLRLHIFLPEGHRRGDRRPAVIFFFGGGWAGGTPRQFFPQARELAGLGLVGISAEYRVRSRHGVMPDACVSDAKVAIRRVRELHDELGVDPERIVAAGGSAGGHLAACAGVVPGFEPEGGATAFDSVPNAMILFNPVVDTTETGFGGDRFRPEHREALSPCHHVRPGLPPTIVFHGESDAVVPFENAQRFVRLMREAGNDCELVGFPGRGHGFFNSPAFRKGARAEDYRAVMDAVIAFLRAHGFLPVQAAEKKALRGSGRSDTTEREVLQ